MTFLEKTIVNKVVNHIKNNDIIVTVDNLETEINKLISTDGVWGYTNKGIEINTGSLYRDMDYMHPHVEILKMYKELGGEILTFGSDAHDTEHIGYMIEDAAELAQAIGFRYFSTFKAMKPEFIKL